MSLATAARRFVVILIAGVGACAPPAPAPQPGPSDATSFIPVPVAGEDAAAVVNSIFVRLFVADSIPLGKDAAFQAHEIIRKSLADEAALQTRAPKNLDGRRAIRHERDSALRALIVSGEDKRKFDVRATALARSEVQPPGHPLP